MTPDVTANVLHEVQMPVNGIRVQNLVLASVIGSTFLVIL